ncbi:hypothetical protein SBY92_005290 [Candida maltosa Xu316]|uniref:Zn(2)-C6 fungal-type domain-containing protein n=1 Tax=Candida maltosa (strain Xu316) TaxID=1245528 RepID=M3HHL2_CANMX|nr:hypothetical protein G210_2946 [Candida maltosa Xu316]
MSKLPVQRRRHTNSKLGCLNCKRKKVRCDESLPECNNCIKGKKETCSYLNLSIQEIEKIKLTHSLRNSQNKLLDQKYRLPTSSAGAISKSRKTEKPTVFAGGDVLDFKFELKNLPIKIPNISYPPLQFNNVFIGDFADGSIVHNDIHKLSDEESSPESIVVDDKKLPNGIHSPLVLNRLNKQIFKRVCPESAQTKVLADLSFHVVIGKSNLLDHTSDLILKLPVYCSSKKMMICAILGLGQSIMLNEFNRKRILHTLQDPQEFKFVESLNKQCLENQGFCTQHLQSLLAYFQENMEDLPPCEVDGISQLGAYTSYSLNFMNLMLKFGPQSYFNSSKGVFKCYEVYCNYIQKRQIQPNSTVNFLRNNLQFNMMSINIPSYPPQFLFEIESNLRSLDFIFNNPIMFENVSINQRYQSLQYQYKSLIKFFSIHLLPVVFESRDENYVTIYPPHTIYEIFKQWHSNCPSEAINHRQTIDPTSPHESAFLNDLATTLYMYYYAIAAALDAVFPACKYLYSMTFMLPTNSFFTKKSIMTISENNPYLTSLFSFKIDKLLQRHIFYSSRLFAFFRRRYIFYHNNTTWENPYNAQLTNNRFKSRTIKNSFEIPIHSFNTTLIRPEHYPTTTHKNKPDGDDNDGLPRFMRDDDTMSKQLYARNIETLDFFDMSSILQYDSETMLLLRDYRPFDDVLKVNRKALDITVIKDYYDDKTIILNSLK